MLKPNYDIAKDRSKTKINYLDVDNEIKKIYDGKKYFLKTYGCQMNVHDSENISAIMEDLGYTKNEDMDKSDVIILNINSGVVIKI